MSLILLSPTDMATSESYGTPNLGLKNNGFRQPPPLQARLIAELIGTCLFVFFGAGCAAKLSDLHAVAAAHGVVAMWLIYMFGPVSGGHFNAGATLAFAVDGKMKAIEVIGYLCAQCIGSLLAGPPLLWLYGINSTLGTPGLKPDATVSQGFAIEFLCTIVLSFVIFFTTTYHPEKEAAFPIGLVIFSSFLLGGNVDGAALNPWRWLGPAVASRTFKEAAWIYGVGPILGFLLGYLIFRLYKYMWNSTTFPGSSTLN